MCVFAIANPCITAYPMLSQKITARKNTTCEAVANCGSSPVLSSIYQYGFTF